MSGPVVLCILDGVGIGAGDEDDAVATAHAPTLCWLRNNAAWRSLRAHGRSVGLPSDADMGNSEVGHNAIGAGRVFEQGAALVEAALADGSAFQGDTWRSLVACRTFHLLGLVSDGNVHSHVRHVHALLDRAAAEGVQRLRLHVLTDGRDVAPRSALTWIGPLEARLAASGRDWRIASGGGRMFVTMDRYQADWRIVQRGWDAHVRGIGRPFRSATEALTTFYLDPKATDQDHPPFVVVDDMGEPVGRIGDGDGVLLFNFRGDRALQITRAFEDDVLPHLDRTPRPSVFFAGMMQYDGDTRLPTHFLVAPPRINDTVGERLVAAGLRSFAVSETQKFGHVTFFFHGNRSGRLDDDLDEWLEIPSDRVPFEQRPWMKAAEITDATVDALRSGRYDAIRLNLANGDMVGHTGDLRAARLAVEAVDLCLGRLVAAVQQTRATLLVTADHGNADQMWQRDKTGAPVRGADGQVVPMTSHTLNPVPFALYGPDRRFRLATDLDQAGIASVGSTFLHLCGVAVPKDWDPSLIQG